MRAAGHTVAQCGGAIAGASVVLALYGTPGPHRITLRCSNRPCLCADLPSAVQANFGLEFLLTFLIVLTYLRYHLVRTDRY